VELEPDLVAFGAANLAATDQLWASIRLAEPGVLGWPRRAPYDRILVSAEAPALPEELVGQLADPGRLVIPVAGSMRLVVLDQGQRSATHHGCYRFVPLR
jgi:protein-L-isoaspartate(D-aspartate) O-methyltransferase